MECTRWEEDGLLFMSDELDMNKKKAYESHLTECSYCMQEISMYRREKEQLFTSEILQVETSAALDEKIRSSCMKTPKPVVSLSPFMAFFKKGVLAALVLGAGLGGGVYIAYNVSSQDANAVVAESRMTPTTTVAQADSIQDSSIQEMPKAETLHRGQNPRSQGVVPVDLTGN